jgi:hypothetical protein
MIQLYKHLEDKNFWYKKYLACTEAYLLALRHAPEIAVDELQLFHGNRESLLKILDSLDEKIQAFVVDAERMGREFSSDQSTKVQFHLREKDSIVARIVALDRELMASLDELRAKGEQKIKLLAKGKKALAKYKSSSQGNEKIDKRV